MGKQSKNYNRGVYWLIAIVVGFLLIGVLFGDVDNASNIMDNPPDDSSTPIATTTPTPEPTQDSDIDPHIIIYKDGQDDIVECRKLSVHSNNNAIGIMNSDVEKIVITGNGNSISYSRNANPQIIDHGNYNDVWQSWLT